MCAKSNHKTDAKAMTSNILVQNNFQKTTKNHVIEEHISGK